MKLCLLSLPDLVSSSATTGSQAVDATAKAAAAAVPTEPVALPTAHNLVSPDVVAHIDTDNTLVLLNKRDLAPNLPSSNMHSGHSAVIDGLAGVNASRVWTASVLKNDGVDVFLSGVVEVLNER